MENATTPYNPLDRVELGKSVERALLARPLTKLSKFPARDSTKFTGAGLYALYYTGSLPCYSPIAPPQQPVGDVPIYVGRARPTGARQGALGLESTTSEPVLFNRLREHAKSILAVQYYSGEATGQPLELSDFQCRYLVADDIWVPLGEALLIGHYRPIWNVVVDGFGNHAPGSGRQQQAKSPWDALHPGRSWALRLPDPTRTSADVMKSMAEHFTNTYRPNLDTAPIIDDDVRRAILGETE